METRHLYCIMCRAPRRAGVFLCSDCTKKCADAELRIAVANLYASPPPQQEVNDE